MTLLPELLKALPDIVIGLIVVYWLLSQLFPQISLFNLSKNSKQRIVTREEWELLFKRYDDIITTMQQAFSAQVDKIEYIIAPLISSIRTTESTVISLMRYLERNEARMDEAVARLKEIQVSLNEIIKHISQIGSRRRAR